MNNTKKKLGSLEVIVPESGSVEDIKFQFSLSFLKDDPAFCKAADAFEAKMEALAAAYNWTQEQLSELCEVAAEASRTAVHCAYYKGLGDGVSVAKELSLDTPATSGSQKTGPIKS